MQTFEVTGKVVTIRAGKLKLSAEQASARQYALRATDINDIYEVVKPTQFKNGEMFVYDGPDLSRAVQINLSDAEVLAESEPAESLRDKALAEINPDADVPVSLLKDALEQKTIGATCKLLAEKYGLKVTKGADTVSSDVFAKIAADYGFEFDEESDETPNA